MLSQLKTPSASSFIDFLLEAAGRPTSSRSRFVNVYDGKSWLSKSSNSATFSDLRASCLFLKWYGIALAAPYQKNLWSSNRNFRSKHLDEPLKTFNSSKSSAFDDSFPLRVTHLSFPVKVLTPTSKLYCLWHCCPLDVIRLLVLNLYHTIDLLFDLV